MTDFGLLAREIGTIQTLDGVREVHALLKMRQAQLIGAESVKFRCGQKVRFLANRAVWRGTITKINQKSIQIIATTGTDERPTRWNVSPTLVTPEEE